MQVGLDLVAAAFSQFRIVTPVIQEEMLQIQAAGISLALVIVLHLGNLILGCHLEILILGLGHTKVSDLVGDLVGDLNNGLVCKIVLAMIHKGLVHTSGFRLQGVVFDQILEFCKEQVSQDSLETNLLCLPEGGEDVFPGQVVRCRGHTLDKCL